MRLLVGFDSAWTRHKDGAIVCVLLDDQQKSTMLLELRPINFTDASDLIRGLIKKHDPKETFVFIDQPIIVRNATGQRPVENIISSPISRRYGGVQPANTGRAGMFCDESPIWSFLGTHNINPYLHARLNIYETYPVLTLIALGVSSADLSTHPRETGSLPKYNPQRKRTFRLADWKNVCNHVADSLARRSFGSLSFSVKNLARLPQPKKSDQDKLDACICLLAGLHYLQGDTCLFVGNLVSGYVLVPHSDEIQRELSGRCLSTGRPSPDWVRQITAQEVSP